MKYNIIFIVPLLAFLFGCVEVKPTDYTEYRKSMPKSILVLPPVNSSVDLQATYSILSTVSFPLAEAGYYVLPVALVDETFKQNGVSIPDEMHKLDLKKLNQIFGADAVLYINVEQYGVKYKVLSSDADVKLGAKLVNSSTGSVLWEGSAFASSGEGNSNSNPIGALIGALLTQILSNMQDDPAYITGARANARLLTPNNVNGILYGPRSPNFKP